MAEFKVQATCDSAEAENVKGSPKKYEESPSEYREYLSELVDEEGGEKGTVYVSVESDLLSNVPFEKGEIEECSNDEEYIEERQEKDDKCEESLLNDEESLSKLVDEERGLEIIVNKENDKVNFRSGDPSKEYEIERVSDYKEYAEERQGDSEFEESLLNDEEFLSKLVIEEGVLELIVNKENEEVNFRSGDPSKEYEIERVLDYKEYAEERQGDSECEESSSEYQESLSELVDEEEDERDTSNAEDIEGDFLSGEPPEQDEIEKSFDDKVCTGERQEADGEENSLVNGVMEKELDFDEDVRYPQYIPKKGIFFQHDVRNKEDAKQKEEFSARDKKKKLWLDGDMPVRWRHDRFCLEEQSPKSEEELIEIYGYDMRNKNGPPQARRQGKYGNWKVSTAYGRGKFRDSRPQGIAGSCSDRDGPRKFRRGPRLQEHDRKEFNCDMSHDKTNTNESGELLINTIKEDSEVNYDISIINGKEFPALPIKETIVEQHCKTSFSGFPESKSVKTLMFENSNQCERNLQDWSIPPRRGKTVPFSNHAKPGSWRPDARGSRATSHRDHRSHGDHRRGRVNRSRISPTFFENKENHLITDTENVVLHQNVGIANDVYSNAFRQLENNDSRVDDDIPIINSRDLPTKESIPEPVTVEHQPFFQKCSLGSPGSKSVRTLIFENSNLSGRNLIKDIPSRRGKVAPFSNHAEHGIRRPIAQRPRGTAREDHNRRAKVIMSHVSPTLLETEENHPTTDCENLALRKTVGGVNGVHSNEFRQPENNGVDCSRNNKSELSVMALKGAGDSADRPRRYSYLQQRRLLETNSYPNSQQAVPSQHSPFCETEYQSICTPTESISTPSIESQSYIPPPINTSSSVYHTFEPATFNPYTESYARCQPTPFSPAEYVVPTPSTQSQSTYISPSINPSPYQPFIPTISDPNTNSYAEYQPSLYVPTEYVVPIPNAQNQSAFAASFNTSTYQSYISTISNPDSNGYGYLPALNNPAVSAVPNPSAQSQSVTSLPLISPSACQPFFPTAHGVYNPYEEKQVLGHAYSFMYKSSINSF